MYFMTQINVPEFFFPVSTIYEIEGKGGISWLILVRQIFRTRSDIRLIKTLSANITHSLFNMMLSFSLDSRMSYSPEVQDQLGRETLAEMA